MFRPVCGFTSLQECRLTNSNEWPQSGNVPEAGNGPSTDSQADKDPCWGKASPRERKFSAASWKGRGKRDRSRRYRANDPRWGRARNSGRCTRHVDDAPDVRYGVLLPLSDVERHLVSFLTRGWATPGGSVMSAPTARYPQGPQGLHRAIPR
jgi:hypothetical protein